MSHGAAEIPDQAFVLRRVPIDWVDPATGVITNILAFLPTRTDVDGFSVDLASVSTVEDTAARGVQGKRYFVARLRIGELKRLAPDLDMTVVPDPKPGNAAHSLIPGLARPRYEANKPRFKALANAIIVELAKPDSDLGALMQPAIP